MKRIVLLLSVVALAFTSCSKSEEGPVAQSLDPNTILVRKIKDVNLNGPYVNDASEVTFTYNGNKLEKADLTQLYGYIEKYTYTGDLITKQEDVMPNNTISVYKTFSYVNNKLDE
jgi:hypothetical protein